MQVLPGSGTDQPLSGGLFYISAQHHLPGQPEGSLFLRGEVKSYLKSGEAARHHRLLQLKEEHEKLQNKKKAEPLIDAETICAFIQKSHDEYLAHKHGVEDDIEHIVEVNHKALDAMMKLLANKRAEWRIRHS